ncbi:uncharacterized protein DDB_G0271850-like [Solanum tuberosum]|uniref:uncharacterized protein DDB_G0271850-like n=1 Tax=Solanum tuberosum TaxID=4113 RepID=UPI00073A1116|nr:PREDICTED: uncharacterized protein DDB_G0271850-like [Solanum tuberosum]
MALVTDATDVRSSTVSTTTHVIQFSPIAQLHIKLQGNLNFSNWKAQLVMLLNGHQLRGHLDGTTPAPSPTITQNDLIVPNSKYQIWFSQDQLIQQAMMASVDPTIDSIVAAVPSANKVWEHLHTAYANKSHTRIFILRDQLQNTKKSSKTIAKYLKEVRSLSDALKVAGSPFNEDELIVKILSGLGLKYHEIFVAVRARDSSLSFEELFHKLTDHELFLKHQDLEKPSSMITFVVAQNSHTSPQFNGNKTRFNNQSWKASQSHEWNSNNQQLNSNNQQNSRPSKQSKSSGNSCVHHSGSTHHVISEPHNLQEYTGTEEISMGDGKTISITHIGSTIIQASKISFKLPDTLWEVVASDKGNPTATQSPLLSIPSLIPLPVESNSNTTTSSLNDVHSNNNDQVPAAAETSCNLYISSLSFSQLPLPPSSHEISPHKPLLTYQRRKNTSRNLPTPPPLPSYPSFNPSNKAVDLFPAIPADPISPPPLNQIVTRS